MTDERAELPSDPRTDQPSHLTSEGCNRWQSIGDEKTLPDEGHLDSDRLTLIKQLGEGGMAVVWLLQRDEGSIARM